MKTIIFKSFAILAVSALSFAASVAKSQDVKPVASDVAALALVQAAQAQKGDGDERQAVRGLLNSSIDYLLPTFGYDWTNGTFCPGLEFCIGRNGGV